jgi:hypothetical protein
MDNLWNQAFQSAESVHSDSTSDSLRLSSHQLALRTRIAPSHARLDTGRFSTPWGSAGWWGGLLPLWDHAILRSSMRSV